GVAIQKIVKDLPEIAFVFLQHLLRLIKRIVSMAQDIEQARMENAIGVVFIASNAFGKALIAVKASRLFQYGSKHVEMIRVKLFCLRGLVELGQSCHMVEKRSVARIAETI